MPKQIVVKTAPGRMGNIEAMVARDVREILGEAAPDDLTVSRVFPSQTTGHRARLYVLELPDDLPDDDIRRILARLRREAALEYAEIPAQKTPMGMGSG